MNTLLSKVGILAVITGILAINAAPSFAWNYWDQRHPARAEVVGRDSRINRELNYDYGNLHGHFGQLKAEDRAIRSQERADAMFNGGRLSPGEYRQLNHEENHLQRQINHDLNW